MLTIYVDADACPVKDEIYRVALRYAMPVKVVANNWMRVPQTPLIELVVRSEVGLNIVDDWIAEQSGPGDIVVTSDIPLAARCVAKQAKVLDPKGVSSPMPTSAKLWRCAICSMSCARPERSPAAPAQWREKMSRSFSANSTNSLTPYAGPTARREPLGTPLPIPH